MNKSIILFLIIMVIAVIGIGVIDNFFDNLSQIVLPKEAHNAVGNIPIVEMLDDGPNYINQREIKYCDETWPMFTCRLRFGYSNNVSHRIASGKYLASCNEAIKEQETDIKFCKDQCREIWSLPEASNFYSDSPDNCFNYCEKEHQYLPECDKDFKK